MALKVADNFSYKGRKPLDERLVVNTLPDLLALASSIIYDGIIVYVKQEYKFYVYDSNNSVDPQLQLWRELKTAGDLISNCTVDTTPTSATYGHLFITLDNGQNIDCGNVIGPKGDQGEGFAIAKEYASVSDMTSDSSPVDDGKMVAVIYTDPVTTKLVADIYIRNSNEPGGTGKNEPGYVYFCNLADATTIQGPQGIQGPKGDKGDAPVITLTPIPATLTSPAGTKVTITVGTDPATQTTVDYSVYNGKDGVGIDNIALNAQNHLIITMTDASTYDLGVIGSGQGGGCITILGCFDTPPTTFVQNDMYYNKTDGKIYKATSNTAWDTGSTPQTDMLYISIDDRTIYAYTNNTFTKYGGNGLSQEPNNAIQEKTDGLYVKNIEPLINQMKAYSRINDARVPEYFFAYGHQGNSGPEEASFRYPGEFNFLPHWDSTETNMDASRYSMTDGYVTLKAGITYKLVASILHSDGQGSYWIENVDTREILATRGFGGPTNALVGYSNVDSCGIITPTEDIKVSVFCGVVSGAPSQGPLYYPSCSYFLIQEMNTLTVDPLEHIDVSKGIQDAPVGHIINYMGTTAPQHYLACDGQTYNIVDYPDLVAHFIKEFGQANEFGGDGVNTFAVPDLSGEFLRGAGTNNHTNSLLGINEGSGGEVGEHQEASVQNYIDKEAGLYLDAYGNNEDYNGNFLKETLDAYTTNNTRYYDGPIDPHSNDPGIDLFTARPTNTSVLYCIKYEPTYFIGQINGAKPVVEDIGSIELTGEDITEHVDHQYPAGTKVITLSRPLSAFDEVEFETYNISNGKKRMTVVQRHFVDDISMHPGTDETFDDCYVLNNVNISSSLTQAGYSVYVVVLDENTIQIQDFTTIGMMMDSVVIKIKGIRSDYSIQ